jgi:hypothetical protein
MKRHSTRRRQSGLTTVEFAIIGSLAMILVFGVIEMARAIFVLNALTEATRRGARIAVVCPVNDPAIAEVAIFNSSGGGSTSPIIHGFDTSDIRLSYLDLGGVVIEDPVTDFGNIRYIEVSVVNFQHELLIPFANFTFTMPELATTLPRESLGVPRSGVITSC